MGHIYQKNVEVFQERNVSQNVVNAELKGFGGILTTNISTVISDHFAAIDRAITPLDAGHAELVGSLTALAEELQNICRGGGRVYVCGNGGSASNAGHLVLHLRDVGVKAFDLMADAPWVSAVANDRAYDQVFSWTLHALAAGPGDLLIVISGSGQSRNIMMALEYAVANKIPRWGLLGMGGGMAKELCEGVVLVDSNDYGTVEDVQSIAIHALHKALLTKP